MMELSPLGGSRLMSVDADAFEQVGVVVDGLATDAGATGDRVDVNRSALLTGTGFCPWRARSLPPTSFSSTAEYFAP
jgi:hypothetical protein